MRKSILACTVSFLMSPMASWALGMGDIQVNSSLNQPLSAEITLHSVTKKDLDSLRIELASKKIYMRANLERSDYLSKFKFKLIQRNGKTYVSVTTKKAFREPFANFLLEATWGSGRLLREYTMLLDPPEFIRKHVRPVTTATASRSAQVKRTTASKTATKKASTSTQASNYMLSPSGSGDMSYGPTKRNDTLWNIAKEMAPDSVSVDQMMMALLRDNPNAFVGNNINNLKAGYVLRIKEPASLNKVSRSNAHKQVKEQYQSWKETRKQKSTANIVDRSDRSVDDKPGDGQLKLVAVGETENAELQGDLSSQAKQLKDKLSIADENLESKEVENQELRARIKELEELLQTKSSLVELKDESLAAMQRQKEMQAVEVPDVTDAMTDAPVEVPDTMTETPDDTEVMVETEVPVESSTEEMSTTESVMEGADIAAENIDPSVELSKDEQAIIEASAPVNVDEIIAMPEVEKPEPIIEETPVVKATPKPVTPPQENVIDVLLNEEMLPYTAGGGALILILLTWLGLRGRGKKENDFEESILDSKMEGADESDFSVDDSQLVDSRAEVLASDTETSFLSDFSADDMESLQPDDTEADPIAEADVFMVYGRYQQAEELLKTALKAEPDRVDYQLKLLEVYHGDNLKDSFGVQADVVKGLLIAKNDDYELSSEWIKAKSWADKLGVEIDMPDSFDEDTTATSEPVESSLDDSLEDDELSLDDLSLDSEVLNLNEDSILGDASDSDDEFDLTLEDEDASEFSLDETDLEDKDESTDDFDLSLDEEAAEFDLDEDILNLNDSPELEGSLELEDSLELDDSSDNDISLDLDDMDGGLELEDRLLEETSESEDSLELADELELEESLELDTLDLDDVDNSLATEGGDELDLLDDDLDFDELEDDFPELDAVGTKLDLAKAYIDMGDMESASSILNEVIDEGDDEQKSQAKSLLDQTNS